MKIIYGKNDFQLDTKRKPPAISGITNDRAAEPTTFWASGVNGTCKLARTVLLVLYICM